MRWRSLLMGAVATVAIAGGLASWSARASDHDDGENDNKARSLNITDLYVFREDWQTGVSGDAANLIVVFNTNPRSMARQQYYFSQNARYEVHFSRVSDIGAAASGLEDVVLRYEFGPADSSSQQPITVTWIEGGQETIATGTATTTNLANSTTDTFTNNSLTVNGQTLTVFAGLREDPFFFDVESFFRMRGGEGLAAVRGTADAVDFTSGYNVNAIVTRIPIAALGSETAFDVWATVSLAMEVEN